ncbi:MAG: PKD domain-containing protein, partial [Saprospiraceae bacterium]|nr:PKD domain-containing protein [Saprospiraceae bacterium]
ILFQNNSVGAERFRWDFGDGGESTQREPSHVYTDAGIYRIQLEVFTLNPVTNQQLCSAVTNSEIRIFQPPERVAFMPSITQGCSPLEVDFTNQSVGEQLGFEWVFGNGQLSSATNPTEIFFEAGLRDTTFAVRLAVGNGCGNAEAVDSIRVFAQPTARFATEIRSEYCSGEIVSIGHRSLADRLEWDFGNGITYTGEEPPDQQYFTGMDQNDTVTLQLLAYNQCGIDTATQSLVIVPTDARAAISVDSDQPCRGDTIYLESLSRPIDALVEWILPDGSRRNGNRIPVIFDQIGTQRIEMKVFSCGQDSASIDLVVQPTPELRLSAPTASCPGELIEVAMQTNAEPQWIIIDLDTFFQRTQATAILDSADLVLVEALAQNNAGCQTSISQFIDLQPSPVANIARIDSICMGSPAVLLSTTEGSSSCLWTLPDGSQRSGCSVMHSFDQSGPQTVGLRVRSQIGCSDSTVAPVFVRPTPVPVFDVVVLDTCTPARIQLIDQSTDADELAWWLPDGQVTYGDTVVFVQSVGGTFNVELRAGNEGICYATLRQEATVFGSPVLSLEKIESCTQDDGFTLVVNAEPEAFVTVTGPDYDAAGSLHTKLQPGGYFLSAETSNGCLTDTVTSIPPVNELFASISGLDSIRIKLGEVFPMEVNVNLSATQVMWSPDIYFSDPQMRLTSVQPLRSGNLVVQVQDERGCVVLDTVYVTVIIDREIGIFIPNAFTPNGDGTNDVFRVRSSNPALEMIEELRVFDPGGNQVFYLQEGLPNDETYGWDGTFQGREATAGGYIYMAILRYVDGEKIIRKGDLNLIR